MSHLCIRKILGKKESMQSMEPNKGIATNDSVSAYNEVVHLRLLFFFIKPC